MTSTCIAVSRWKKFLELYRVPGVQLYSLQVGEASQEANVIGAISLIKDLVPYIQSDVTATLALMKNLDLIICCRVGSGALRGVVRQGMLGLVLLLGAGLPYRPRRH